MLVAPELGEEFRGHVPCRRPVSRILFPRASMVEGCLGSEASLLHCSRQNLTVSTNDCLIGRMENTEQEAIRRVLAGDRDAFRILMDRHLPAVIRMTYRVTGNDMDAEEAAQEAFLLAYKKLPDFREESAFGTWVYRIAMNCSLNLVKRRSREASWNAVPLDSGPVVGGIGVSEDTTPEEELLNAEALQRRERAMQTLTPMERAAFVLRHMEDQPMRDIAEALGVTVNSAKQAIFRAVSKLRRELAPAMSKTESRSPAIAKEAR